MRDLNHVAEELEKLQQIAEITQETHQHPDELEDLDPSQIREIHKKLFAAQQPTPHDAHKVPVFDSETFSGTANTKPPDSLKAFHSRVQELLSSGPINVSGNTECAPKRDTPLEMPAAFPSHPDAVRGTYTPPPMPKIENEHKKVETLRLMVNAYRAAIDYNTGKPCNLYSDGLDRGTSTVLLRAAKELARLELSPYLWCAAMMLRHRGEATEAGKTWRPLQLRQIYATKAIKTFAAFVKSRGPAWQVSEWCPPTYTALVDRWNTVRTELRDMMRDQYVTQQGLEKWAAEAMPARVVDSCWLKIDREKRSRFSEDVYDISTGRWVWSRAKGGSGE